MASKIAEANEGVHKLAISVAVSTSEYLKLLIPHVFSRYWDAARD
jgi:hypothetical protein